LIIPKLFFEFGSEPTLVDSVVFAQHDYLSQGRNKSAAACVGYAAFHSEEMEQLRRLDTKLLQRGEHAFGRSHFHDEGLACFEQTLEA
jgi:hypothetical protein